MEVLAFILLLASVEALSSYTDLRHVHAFLANSEHQLRTRYRPMYHLYAPFGWLNNPAAFVFFKRKYHLFYQYHPYDGAWGAVAWGHAVSADLVRWAHYPSAMQPREPYDRHGCLAGSAAQHNGYLALFYTGQAIVSNYTRTTLSIAVSADGVIFQKYLYNPVMRNMPPRATDFRNPKVWRYRDVWYMLVGASIARRGHLLLYTSPNLYAWRPNGTVARSLGDMGHTWESPDLFELDGLCVLLLSAQGIRSDGDRFRNLQQTGYVLGRYDCGAATVGDLEVSTATFEELDRGHDFYAAKTTRAIDGRRLMVAWLGMWEGRFEEAHDGWAGAMAIVRELRLGRRGQILQIPVQEQLKLRKELVENAWYSPGETFDTGTKAFELLVNATCSTYDAEIALMWEGERQYTISYWAARGVVGVDRGGADGVRRADWAPTGHLHWRIFVDRSSVEVFCGSGEVVFSSRIYPRGPLRLRIGADAQLHLTQYRIRRSIGYDPELRNYLKNHVLNKYQ